MGVLIADFDPALMLGLFTVFGVPLFLVVFLLILRRIGTLPMHYGLSQCEKCGYDLRGNTMGRCPECGEVISENQRLLLASLPKLAEQAKRESSVGDP